MGIVTLRSLESEEKDYQAHLNRQKDINAARKGCRPPYILRQRLKEAR